MDASKKQREPVAFKSLAELKRFIRPGVEFKTVSHANHADMVGLTRVVTTVQTVGFYSKIKDQPEHPFSTCNHGKGFYTDFGKAGNYIFDGTTVKVKDARKKDRGVIYELEFYDREQNMEEMLLTSERCPSCLTMQDEDCPYRSADIPIETQVRVCPRSSLRAAVRPASLPSEAILPMNRLSVPLLDTQEWTSIRSLAETTSW